MLMSTLLVVALVIILAVLMPLMAFSVIQDMQATIGRTAREQAAKDGQGHHGTMVRLMGNAATGADPTAQDTTTAGGIVTVAVAGAGQILGVSVSPISTNIGRIRVVSLDVGSFDLIFESTTFTVLNVQLVDFAYTVHFTPA